MLVSSLSIAAGPRPVPSRVKMAGAASATEMASRRGPDSLVLELQLDRGPARDRVGDDGVDLIRLGEQNRRGLAVDDDARAGE